MERQSKQEIVVFLFCIPEHTHRYTKHIYIYTEVFIFYYSFHLTVDPKNIVISQLQLKTESKRRRRQGGSLYHISSLLVLNIKNFHLEEGKL